MSRLITVSFVCAVLCGTDSSALAANSCTMVFKETTLTAGSNPDAIVTGDFNGDGKPDFAVVDYDYDDNDVSFVSVFLGNGDGTFQDKQDYGVGAGPDALTLGDVNGDGITDLVTGNDSGSTVSVLLGKGDGSFEPHQDYSVGRNPHGVALGDFNGDHALDIATANETDNSVSVLLNNGDGTFAAMTTLTGIAVPDSITAGDFNADGNTDLAVAAGNGVVSVLIGKGDGTFNSVQNYGTGGQPSVVLARDFNGDGALDLATANYNNGDNTGSVSILLGKDDGTFAAHKDYLVGAGPDGLTAGKITGDRYVDLAVTDQLGDSLVILPGKGDGRFGRAQSFITPDFPHAVAAARFHGQKRTKDDLVVSDGFENQATIFRNKGCR